MAKVSTLKKKKRPREPGWVQVGDAPGNEVVDEAKQHVETEKEAGEGCEELWPADRHEVMKQVLDDFPGDTLRGHHSPTELDVPQPDGSRAKRMACGKSRSNGRALVELPLRPNHPNVGTFGSATRNDELQAIMLLLIFLGSTVCWSVTISGSPRPTLLAIAGNAAVLGVLFLSMQPARVAKTEIGFDAAVFPLMALVLIDRPRL